MRSSAHPGFRCVTCAGRGELGAAVGEELGVTVGVELEVAVAVGPGVVAPAVGLAGSGVTTGGAELPPLHPVMPIARTSEVATASVRRRRRAKIMCPP